MEQAREYAEKLLAARGGEEAPPAKEKQAREAGWGATAAALGSQFLGGGERPAEAGTAGDKQPGGAGGLMGTAAHMAQGWLAGGEGAAAGEGGHKADPGLVDKLLGLYAQTQGKPFEGRSEGEYDQLAGLAHGALGTPIGREVLKAWVKQRLGI